MAVKDTELSWLAGVIESEGSITLGRAKNKGYCSVFVHFCNTDLQMVAEVRRIYDALGLRYWYRLGPPEGRLGTKPLVRMTVSSFPQVHTLLCAILCYMRSSKAARAEALIELAESRMPKRNRGSNKSRAYTQDEINLAENIRAIK